jgi:hypothetical protein
LAGAPGGAGGAAATTGPRRRRGQQPGRPGHGRRNYDHLPARHETAERPPPQRRGAPCGRPLTPCGSEPPLSTLIEVDVRGHRRLRRRRYRPTCACGTRPERVVAPPPARLIPKSCLGVSLGVALLLDKYAS